MKDTEQVNANMRVNSAIIDLFLGLFNAKEFAANLSANTKSLVEIVEYESMKLERAQHYSDSQRVYLLDSFLPLFNFYSENFLKDLLFSENINEIDQRKKFFKFASTLLRSLDK